MLNESDIYAEYPADVDDENVLEQGFQFTLPGESTRLSSALALFRLARIMSKVLDTNYPAASVHDLSLQKIAMLNDELDAWLGKLAPHLRLQFVQDKPSTNIVGSRSPLMVRILLVYESSRFLTFLTVPWLPLPPHTYSPSSRWRKSWQQSFNISHCSCSIQQTHHSTSKVT